MAVFFCPHDLSIDTHVRWGVRWISSARRALCAGFAVLVMAGLSPSYAYAAVEVRASPHVEAGGFGRVVFDFNRKVGWRAAIENNTLTINFDSPIPAGLQRVKSALAQWVTGETLSSDNKTLTLTLKPGLGIRTSVGANGAVAVDIATTAAGGKPGPFGPLSAPPATASATPPSNTPVSPPATATTASPPPATKASAQTAQLIPVTPLKETAAASPVTPQAAQSSAPAPVSAPMMPAPSATPAPAPAVASAAPAASAPSAPSQPAFSKPIGVPGGPAIVADPDAPPVVEKPAPTLAQMAKVAPVSRPASLPFPTTDPTAIAVFERAGYTWVVLDRHTAPDLPALVKSSAGVVMFADQQADASATLVRMIVAPGYHPFVHQDAGTWVVDLKVQPYKPDHPVNSEPQLNSADGPRLFVPIAGASRAITVTDPDVGDQFVVVPATAVGTGVWPQRATVDVDVPQTATGVIVEPHSDQVAIDVTSDGVVIAAPGGLPLSTELSDTGASEMATKANFTRVLAIGDWAKGGGLNFDATRERLTVAAAVATEDDREVARLDLARFLFANNRSTEALGILRVIIKARADAENTAAVRGLRGAAELMMGRDSNAFADFSHPSLAGFEDANYWRAIAQTRVGDSASVLPLLKLKADLLKEYPLHFRKYLALEVATAANLANDSTGTKQFITLARSSDLTPHERAQIRYFEGAVSAANKLQAEEALIAWDDVSKGPDREYAAIATRDQLELLYRLRKIDRTALLRGLETLRYSWRGGRFEFDLLMRIAQLYSDNQQYDLAMNTWKRVSQYYKGTERATQALGHMQETFDHLYGDGDADSLSPIKAISLFDQFRDLLPAGDKGDQMINSLANRLVSVDLLPQAGQLLDRQIRYRLSGTERARVGARLALVYLLDHKPDLALEAILRSKDPGVSADLDHQRQQLLSRSMADLNRTDDALSVIANDNTRDADLLRAEINWRAQRWKAAADSLFKLIPPPGAGLVLTEDQGSTLLDLGAALTLANDEERVAQVRTDYYEAMKRTSYVTPFDLITTPPTSGLINVESIKSRVQQAEDFKSFLATYKERLLAGGLGSIN